MVQPMKTLHFDPDTLKILREMVWEEANGDFLGTIETQLDRAAYLKVQKALEAMGGKWVRSKKAHVFPKDPRHQVDGLVESGQLSVVRDGYFPTPHDLGVDMAKRARLKPEMFVLEPSAGTGELALAILEVEPSVHLTCVELDPERAIVLEGLGFSTVNANFLKCEETRLWDRVIMNPPFEQEQDIDHVRHAFGMLKYGGRLVAIMGEGTFFHQTRHATEFRSWLMQHKFLIEPLENGLLQANARLVIIDK